MTATRYRDDLPSALVELGLDSSGVVLVYDRVLEERFGGFVELFAARYPVAAGEELKALDAFPAHMAAILDLVGSRSRSEITVATAGGGSVGDFGGFVASVLKRGVDLVHLPTTWLAAMDSAHGGKTALNVGGVKNQIGTFHPAREVVVIKPLLQAVSAAERRSACGELIKMAMLAGGGLFEGAAAARSFDDDELWRLLPGVVAAKDEVVASDPEETMGRRQILNLGHTFGHALEAHLGLAHGVAVGLGLRFTIEWSMQLSYLSADEGGQLLLLLDRFPEFDRSGIDGLDPTQLASLLDRDKKSEGPGRVQFVFLESVGNPRVESVSVDDVMTEAGRQGWL